LIDRLRESECDKSISDANLYAVFCSNYRHILLSVRDMTTGRTTDGLTLRRFAFLAVPAKTPTSMGRVRPSRIVEIPTSVLRRRMDVRQTSARSLKPLNCSNSTVVTRRPIDVPDRRRPDVNESTLLTKLTLARCVPSLPWRHF